VIVAGFYSQTEKRVKHARPLRERVCDGVSTYFGALFCGASSTGRARVAGPVRLVIEPADVDRVGAVNHPRDR